MKKNIVLLTGTREKAHRKDCSPVDNCHAKRTGSPSTGEKPSEFYIIIFLNKLKIVENTSPKIKGLWLRLWGPSEIHGPLLGSLGPGLMYRH
jgi:hypothetical protein